MILQIRNIIQSYSLLNMNKEYYSIYEDRYNHITNKITGILYNWRLLNICTCMSNTIIYGTMSNRRVCVIPRNYMYSKACDH